MKIARIFPTKTSMSPDDKDCYFGSPEFFMPKYDKVHISIVFTWDILHGNLLAKQWLPVAPVLIGGPAVQGEMPEEFTPGMYLKKGNVITSRGCPRMCSWCFVDKPLKELKIHEGSNILDNNLLACSKSHIDKVFEMLKGQKRIKFTGGLEADLITDRIALMIRGLKIRQIYTAYDHEGGFRAVERAFRILRKYFTRDHLGCYVLIGFNNDTMDEAEGRLRQVLDLGGMPFAMLYRDKAGRYPQPELRWRNFQREWCRPAAIRTKVRKDGRV